MHRFSPAAARNAAAILPVLREVLPDDARVLEIASGTGQHAAAFTEAMPGWTWQPSDVDPDALEGIDAWTKGRARPALQLDVTAPGWWTHPTLATLAPSAIYCANMIHIAPWPAALGLLDGAAALLGAGRDGSDSGDSGDSADSGDGGLLVLYGPFAEGGVLEPESNRAFDASLKSRDPRWGVRDLDDVRREAAARGLTLVSQRAMPANNRMVEVGG